VLIDDYDTPALYAGCNDKKVEETLRRIEGFLNPLKGQYLTFLFITGTTRYPESALRSGLNLSQETFSPEYSAICGITEDEMLQEIGDGIQEMADANGWTKDECVAELRNNYGGYRFSPKSPEIYNPYSLLKALESKKIGQYWASTTPEYIIKYMNKYHIKPQSLGRQRSYKSVFYLPLNSIRIALSGKSRITPILYQSGYFTIKEYDSDRDEYIIDIPNNEIRENLKSKIGKWWNRKNLLFNKRNWH